MPVNITGVAAARRRRERPVARAAAAVAPGRRRHDPRDESTARADVDSLARTDRARRHGRRARACRFDGIAPGATFTYRFRVNQYGTYWYHSHSRFQEQVGLLRSDRDRAARRRAASRTIASTWCCCPTGPTTIRSDLRDAQEAARLLQLTASARSATSCATRASAAWRRAAADRRMWAGMRMKPTDLADVGGLRLHLSHERRRRRPANWTGTVRARRARAPAVHQRLVDELLRRAHSGIEDDGGRDRRPGRRARHRRRVRASARRKSTT